MAEQLVEYVGPARKIADGEPLASAITCFAVSL